VNPFRFVRGIKRSKDRVGIIGEEGEDVVKCEKFRAERGTPLSCDAALVPVAIPPLQLPSISKCAQ
jgi:hypothetical protein